VVFASAAREPSIRTAVRIAKKAAEILLRMHTPSDAVQIV
jgi:hypothetical protein